MKKDKEFDYFIRKFARILAFIADNGNDKLFSSMAENGIIEDRDDTDISIGGMSVKTDNEFFIKIKNNRKALKKYYKKDIGKQGELTIVFDSFVDTFIRELN